MSGLAGQRMMAYFLEEMLYVVTIFISTNMSMS